MNIRFFVVLSLLSWFVLDSQSQSARSTDSLQIELANASGQSQVALLYELSYAYVAGASNDEALPYAWEGYRLSSVYVDSLNLRHAQGIGPVEAR